MNRNFGRFDNCISLGWFCGTAGSMERLGLRACSGPFDWYFSDQYSGVLSQIENDFSDFLNRDNLKQTDEDKMQMTFRDVRYGFIYNHEIKNDFDSEYGEIYEKYERRIKSFRKMITHPTCFFRCIRDQSEVDYINKNYIYADDVLRKCCSDNRVIYLYHKGLTGLTANIESYMLNIEKYVGETYEMTHMFDSSPELLQTCSNILCYNDLKKNKEFYIRKVNNKKHNEAYRIVRKRIEKNWDGLEEVILKALDSFRRDGIYLWGAGKAGMLLAIYLREKGVYVKGIIDNNHIGECIEDFDICSFDSVENGSKIFIAVYKIEYNEAIEKQIRSNPHKKIKYAKYMNLYDEL